VLADDVMTRVERGETTDAQAFELALEFAQLEGFDFRSCVDEDAPPCG